MSIGAIVCIDLTMLVHSKYCPLLRWNFCCTLNICIYALSVTRASIWIHHRLRLLNLTEKMVELRERHLCMSHTLHVSLFSAEQTTTKKTSITWNHHRPIPSDIIWCLKTNTQNIVVWRVGLGLVGKWNYCIRSGILPTFVVSQNSWTMTGSKFFTTSSARSSNWRGKRDLWYRYPHLITKSPLWHKLGGGKSYWGFTSMHFVRTG